MGPWVAKIERLIHVFDRLVCRDIDMLRSLKTKRPFFPPAVPLGNFKSHQKLA